MKGPNVDKLTVVADYMRRSGFPSFNIDLKKTINKGVERVEGRAWRDDDETTYKVAGNITDNGEFSILISDPAVDPFEGLTE